MRRREVIAGLMGATVALPVPVWSQPGKVYRVSFLSYRGCSASLDTNGAFREGLREAGYVEGKNLLLECRDAPGRVDRFPELALELVRLKSDVLIAEGTPASLSAKQVTTTVPIVFAPAGDPVRSGLVPSLASPGGNLTGVSLYATELNQKRLEVLKEALPGLRRVGALWNAGNPAQGRYWNDLRAAAERLGIEARAIKANGVSDLEARFAETRGESLDGLVVVTDAEFDAGRKEIVRLAAEYRLAAMYEHRAFVEVGGLMSYGPNIDQLSYRAAAYIDKILKGAPPADLPVEQAPTYQLIVNLKTAKALGTDNPAHAPRPRRRGDRMRRREFIALAGVLVVWPIVGHAQQSRSQRRIGVLNPELASLAPLPAFLEELRLLGWRDRENVLIDIRSADGRYELISQLAHELVRALPDVIYTLGPDATLAAAAATKTLPIVAIDLEFDRITTGLVENLARPGRNVTGLFLDLPELAGKWLELLGEMVPQLTRVGVLGTTRINKAQFAAVEKASGISRYQLLRLNIDDARALEGAFETAARERVQGVVVSLLLSSS